MSDPTANTQAGRAGQFAHVASDGDSYSTFSPKPLPPDPPLVIDAEMQRLLDRANQALGRLDGITLLLPDADRFLYSYLRKEAVLSSQIEGTQSSLSDLLLFEHDVAPGVPEEDVREATNYLAALNLGLKSMEEGLPLSLRLLKQVHAELLRGTRGGETGPGEFRRIQNWLGGPGPAAARYVPPPSNQVPAAMADLEKFLHGEPVAMPVLIRAALAHAQFETIHPFLDGNGRLGRLLITLLLCSDTADGESRVLSRPLLYLSLHLKSHRDIYYERLQAVRTDGDWEGWLRFFLEGVISVADLASETTKRIVELIERDRGQINALGRAAGSALLVFDRAVREVVIRIPETVEQLPISEPTVATAIGHLERIGILHERTGRPRNKIFAYDKYLKILSEGTEPL
ncbi:MAG TPA: Fic family protein [Solirubrobacterales bacterium]